MKRIFLAIALLGELLIPPLANAGEAGPLWPDFPAPAGANVGWIAQDIVYNGIPMQIRHLKSTLKPDEIVDFYRHTWQKTRNDRLILEKRPPWYLVHKMTESVFYTVEVRQSGNGSEAILTMSRLPEIQKKFIKDNTSLSKLISAQGAGFPKITGSIVQMDMTSFDDGIQARTIMYRNHSDVETNVLYIAEQLVVSGWSKIGDYPTRNADQGRQLVFKRSAEQIVMTVRQESGTTEVVANHTKQL